MEFDQEPLAIGIGGARDLFTQARQITLRDSQFGLDRALIERIWGNRLVGEHGAALRRYLGEATDDEYPPPSGLALVNLDHPRPDRRNQRRMTRQYTEIAFGTGDNDHLDRFGQQQALRGDQLELHAPVHRV